MQLLKQVTNKLDSKFAWPRSPRKQQSATHFELIRPIRRFCVCMRACSWTTQTSFAWSTRTITAELCKSCVRISACSHIAIMCASMIAHVHVHMHNGSTNLHQNVKNFTHTHCYQHRVFSLCLASYSTLDPTPAGIGAVSRRRHPVLPAQTETTSDLHRDSSRSHSACPLFSRVCIAYKHVGHTLTHVHAMQTHKVRT